ncbi:MAG TPA: nicotinate (nicotinamide) nucleotide adenylyltransferase [Bryobacteraceae bacterium]|nr:nicotinate (nicotinamide) nucleotide adenylyltransferase [Bryobacteraceae bacterium]
MSHAYAVFGGTFDPIHKGHVSVAKAAADRFNLDEVLLIPAGNPPHKGGQTRAAFEHRLRMAALACTADPRLRVSAMEEGSARSYSILTIERLKRERPNQHVYFLIGADAFSEIETWFRWRDVLTEVEFLVVSRPGSQYDIPQGARAHRLDDLEIPISSSRIREQLRAGERPETLDAAVFDYIRQHGLYKEAG